MTDRLHRVVGHPDRRRKLGDRNPSRAANHVSERRNQRRLAVDSHAGDPPAEPRGTVIPLYDRLPQAGPAQGRRVGPPASREMIAEKDCAASAGRDESVLLELPCEELSVESAPVVPVRAMPTSEIAPDGPPEPIDVEVNEADAPPAGAAAVVDVVGEADKGSVFGSAPAGHVGPVAVYAESEPERAEPAEGPVQKMSSLLEIAAVIEELVRCANEGRVLRGLALYSDDHLFRFMDSTGLADDEFRDAFSRVQPRPTDRWERLEGLDDLVVLPDGRIDVTASYVDAAGRPANGRERYRMLFDADRRMWLIDDIVPLDPED